MINCFIKYINTLFIKNIYLKKKGVGRLIADSKVTPIVLPFYHYGLDDILPNKQPYVPRTGQKSTIVIGKPIYFDDLVKELKQKQKTAVIFILI